MRPDWENEGIEETTGVWDHQQKKQWLLNRLYELSKTKGSNTFDLKLMDVVSEIEDPLDVREDLFFAHEQRSFLDVLVMENVAEITRIIDNNHLSIRLIERSRSSKSMYCQAGYKTVRDVLLDLSLRADLLGIIKRAYGVVNEREIKRGLHLKTDVDERWDGLYQDEKIQLLEELGMAKADWERLKSQTHRTIGSRLINVYFDGEKVTDFIDALIGKKSFINPLALEHIADLVKDFMSREKWCNFLIESGVPNSLFPDNPSKKELLYEILLTLCSTGDERDKQTVEKIFSNLVHPLIHGGKDEIAERYEWDISKLLKYDGYCLLEGKLRPLDDESKEKINSKQTAADDELADVKTASSLNCSLEELEAMGMSRRSYVGKTSRPLPNTKIAAPATDTQESEPDEAVYVRSLTVSDLFFQAKIVIAQLYRILEMICTQPIYIADEGMNHVYTVYHHYLEILATRAELGDVRSYLSDLPESLLTDYEYFSIQWEDGYKQSLSKMQAKVERHLILNPIKDVNAIKVPEHFSTLAEHSNQILAKYADIATKGFNKIMKIAEEQAKANKPPVTPPTEREREMPTKVEFHIHNSVNNHVTSANNALDEKEQPYKFPHKLPSGTRWEDVLIKFHDDERVLIQVKQFKLETDYRKMGFIGKGKDPNPSTTWIFLKTLATVNGELTIRDSSAKDTYKKQKELLTKSLQGYFGIEYDPFYPYRSSPEKPGNSYKVKITLLPPTDSARKQTENEDDKEDILGVREELDKLAPQVYSEDD